MAPLLENVMLTLGSPWTAYESPRNITVDLSIFLVV